MRLSGSVAQHVAAGTVQPHQREGVLGLMAVIFQWWSSADTVQDTINFVLNYDSLVLTPNFLLLHTLGSYSNYHHTLLYN